MTALSRGTNWLAGVGAEVQEAAGRAHQWLTDRPTLDLIAPLTLVLLLLYPSRVPAVRTGLQIGCVTGLLYRPLQRVPLFWVLLAAGMGLGCVLMWEDADNHKYLITYWCLAIGLSCAAEDTSRALRINARLLIGLCFLLAVFWKLWTPDFLTGEFYEFALLTDDRLFGLAQLFTDMQPEVYFQNREAIERLTAYASTQKQVTLEGAARVRSLSTVLTVWTIFIEVWVAVSFLWPGPSRWAARSRDVSLLVFAVTTYFAATVSGFAWVLLIMGLAQVRTGRADWRSAYLGVLAVVILYQLEPVNALLVWIEG